MPFSINAIRSAFVGNASSPSGSASSGAPAQEYNVNPVTTGPLAPQFAHDDPKSRHLVQIAIRQVKNLVTDLRASTGTFVFRNSWADVNFYGYGSGKPRDAIVTEKLPGDRLDLTVLLNVSGHDFRERFEAGTKTRDECMKLVKDRARNNSYNVAVRYPNGNSVLMRGIAAKGALFTVQDLSVKLQPGKNVIEVWPDGSAGVSGYVEGRRLEITYAPKG